MTQGAQHTEHSKVKRTSAVKFIIMVKFHKGVGSLHLHFFPPTVDSGGLAPTIFLITYLNHMQIPKYCQNKQHKYGKPEEDGTWHGERVGARWAHFPEQWRCWSALVGPDNRTRPRGARLSECQDEGAAARASQQAVTLPAAGSPFSCPPCGYKKPLICTHIRVRTHTHTHRLFTITNACPHPN